jgi:DNA invertase Pin-like site-specific DNA recombinase
MKTAAIMSRVSSDEQALGFSLGIQEESLLKYCEKNEIRVTYKITEDHSAKDFNRPEFIKFMDYAKKNKGKIDYLLVTSWDRFSRNITDALIVIRKLKNWGISVSAIEQPIDPTVPENLIILAMYLAIPEIDNSRRSLKIKQGMRAALRAGRWCRAAPYGYKNSRDETNKPIILPGDKADNVTFLFEEISKGKSQIEVIEELRLKDVKLNKSKVSDILRNPVYKGMIRIAANDEQPELIVEGQHEGLVTSDLFDRVNRILENNHKQRNRYKYNTSKEELFLRGNLTCSKCGQPLTGSRSKSGSGNKYFYYHCNYCSQERYRADNANQIMKEILAGFGFKKEVKVLYNELLKEMMNGSEADRKRRIVKLKDELAKHETRIVRAQDMHVDGSLSNSDYQSMINRYSSDKYKTGKELGELLKAKSAWEGYLDKGIGMLSNLEKTFNQAAPRQKREIISSIFPEKLVFDGNKCRTPRLNEVLYRILLIDNNISESKNGQLHQKLKLSAKVEHIGIEPMTS